MAFCSRAIALACIDKEVKGGHQGSCVRLQSMSGLSVCPAHIRFLYLPPESANRLVCCAPVHLS